MFILTNVNLEKDLVTILNTKDLTNEDLRLGYLSQKINDGTIKVADISKDKGNGDYLDGYNISIDLNEARIKLKEIQEKYNSNKG